jgi:hypothetical protein
MKVTLTIEKDMKGSDAMGVHDIVPSRGSKSAPSVEPSFDTGEAKEMANRIHMIHSSMFMRRVGSYVSFSTQ